MCGGGGDNGASEAAAQQQAFLVDQQSKADAKEAQRQADIVSGTQQINDAYSGYTPDYYAKIASDYVNDYADPQIAVAQNKDLQQSKYGMARSGLSNSSAATKEVGDINQIYGQAATDAANRGEGMAQDRMNQVNAARSTAMNQLQAADSPLTTMANAIAGAQSYTVAPAAVAITDLLSNAAALVNRSYMNSQIGSSGGGSIYSNTSSTAGGAGTTKVL